MFEKLFKLKANGTTIRTEIIAGITSFMTIAYIPVVPRSSRDALLLFDI